MPVHFDVEQRAVVEGWQLAAMVYGWRIAQLGLPQPDPLFTWRDGIPEVVAEGALLDIGDLS